MGLLILRLPMVLQWKVGNGERYIDIDSITSLFQELPWSLSGRDHMSVKETEGLSMLVEWTIYLETGIVGTPRIIAKSLISVRITIHSLFWTLESVKHPSQSTTTTKWNCMRKVTAFLWSSDRRKTQNLLQLWKSLSTIVKAAQRPATITGIVIISANCDAAVYVDVVNMCKIQYYCLFFFD